MIKLTEEGSDLVTNSFSSARTILKKTNDTIYSTGSFTPIITSLLGTVQQIDPYVSLFNIF